MNRWIMKTRKPQLLLVPKFVSTAFVLALFCQESVANKYDDTDDMGKDKAAKAAQQDSSELESADEGAAKALSTANTNNTGVERLGNNSSDLDVLHAAPSPTKEAATNESAMDGKDLPALPSAEPEGDEVVYLEPESPAPTPTASVVSEAPTLRRIKDARMKSESGRQAAPATPIPFARPQKEFFSSGGSQEEQKEETPLIRSLLQEAEKAFLGGRLLEPSHDNAYDRYQSVLILDKNNRRARSGLKEILRRYSSLVKDALNYNRFSRAESLINKLSHFYPDDPKVKEQRRALATARKKIESKAVVSSAKKVAPSEDIPLPIPQLNKRSDEVLSLLSEIVVRLIESDESIMIYARSDAEGRWVYKQMKRLSGGYRIRGDIRISSNPRIVVLPPL